MSCENKCNSTGLAILPVRYAVMPGIIKSALPSWAKNPLVTDINLENGDHYALRVLRQGYLYLFYSQSAKGKNYWECFSIADDGSLWLQNSVIMPREIKSPDCKIDGMHSSVNVEFFCIEKPEKCSDVWIAYSQFEWSEQTLDRYKKDKSARNQRMQKITPKKWINTQKQQGATSLTQQTLNDVLDYQDISYSGLMPDLNDQKARDLSTAPTLPTIIVSENTEGDYPRTKTTRVPSTGSYQVDQSLLNSYSTLYPWVSPRRSRGVTVDRTQQRSKRSNGSPCKPLLLPLWDAVGIVHELNGWCMDVLGRQAQFHIERDIEMNTHRDLEALEGVLYETKKKEIEHRREIMGEREKSLLSNNPEIIELRRKELQKRYKDVPDILQQAMSDCDLLDEWYVQNIPDAYAMKLMVDPLTPLIPHQQYVTQLKLDVSQYKRTRDGCWVDSWLPYKKKLDNTRRDGFVQCYEALCKDIEVIYQKRSESLLNWLVAPLLITTVEDYHSTEFQDGINYQKIITPAICGIGNTVQGGALLDKWIEGYSANDCSNLLWRHVAGNDPDIIEELEPLLLQVKEKQSEHTPITQSILISALSQSSNLKKYTSFYQKSVKGLTDKNITSWTDRQFYKMDGFMASIGDRIFNLGKFGGKLDSFNESVFKVIFSLRAGVPPEHVLNLMEAQLKDRNAYLTSFLEEIKDSKEFMTVNQEKLAKFSNMEKAQADFYKSEEGQVAIKNSRIGLVLFFFNILDFNYLYSQLKDDVKSKATLVASGLTMIYQVSDIIMPALEKGVVASKWTVGLVKGGGALMGAAASAISVALDFDNLSSEANKGRFGLVGFYFFKATVDTLAVLKSAQVVFGFIKYTVPASEKIAAMFGVRLLGMRVLAALVSWEVAVALIFLQVILSLIVDNELEVWCRQCWFGSEPLFLGYDEQKKRLDSAIKAVM